MRLRSYQKRRLKNRLHPEINITPLIDVALTLLIIFMVATPAIKYNQAQKEGYATAVVADKNRSVSGTVEVLKIIIKNDGVIFYNGQKLTLFELKKIVQGYKNRSEQVGLVINPVSSLPCGKILELVKTLQHLDGVSYVELVTHDTL